MISTNKRTPGSVYFYLSNRQKYNEVMKMPEQLETKRLILRKPRMEAVLAIFDGWAQDRKVTRYLTWRKGSLCSI